MPPPNAPTQASRNPAPVTPTKVMLGVHTHHTPKTSRSHINKNTAIPCRHTHRDWHTNTDPQNSALTNTLNPAQSHPHGVSSMHTVTCTKTHTWKFFLKSTYTSMLVYTHAIIVHRCTLMHANTLTFECPKVSIHAYTETNENKSTQTNTQQNYTQLQTHKFAQKRHISKCTRMIDYYL